MFASFSTFCSFYTFALRGVNLTLYKTVVTGTKLYKLWLFYILLGSFLGTHLNSYRKNMPRNMNMVDESEEQIIKRFCRVADKWKWNLWQSVDHIEEDYLLQCLRFCLKTPTNMKHHNILQSKDCRYISKCDEWCHQVKMSNPLKLICSICKMLQYK